MKRIMKAVLWLMTTVCALPSLAESKYPTVVEGEEGFNITKYWRVRHVMEDGTAQSRAYIIYSKDSIVGEKKYTPVLVNDMVMTMETSGWLSTPVDFGLGRKGTAYMRQEGDKVFWIGKDKTEHLVLDYGLKEGDAFVNCEGEKFVVTETGFFDEYAPCVYYPGKDLRMLRLRSEDGTGEDVWIEGMGSVNWGIVPQSALREILGSEEMPVGTQIYMVTGSGPDFMFNVNEGHYKFTHFLSDSQELSTNEVRLDFSFHADTLCIKGVYGLPITDAPSYIECVIDENNSLYFNFWGLLVIKSGLSPVAIDAKLPGFQPGEYHVSDWLTLTCLGADDIKTVCTEKTDRTAVYDLSGRKVNPKLPLKHGIYIKGGKKVVVGKD